MQYILYKIKDEYKELFNTYPCLKCLFNHANSEFYLKQIQEVTDDMVEFNKYIYQQLYKRNDYFKINNTHFIINKITKDKTRCIVNQNNVTIISRNQNNVFLNIMYEYSKDYVIINQV